MTFILTTATGRIYNFYIEETAKMFQRAYGGQLARMLNT